MGKQVYNPLLKKGFQGMSIPGYLDGIIKLDAVAQIGPVVSGVQIDNLSHADLATGNYLLLLPTADIDITGITAPLEAIYQMLFISNISSTQKVVLKNNSASSLADNRFFFSQDITIDENMGLIMLYDQVMTKWRPFLPTVPGGGGLNALETATLDGSIITPAQLLADQDDYNPTGFSTCQMIRQDINGNRVITGFVAPAAGVDRIFAITNLSGSDRIKFKNNDSSSAAANRLLIRDNAGDKEIHEQETAIFWYDHTSSRWRPYNRIG